MSDKSKLEYLIPTYRGREHYYKKEIEEGFIYAYQPPPHFSEQKNYGKQLGWEYNKFWSCKVNKHNDSCYDKRIKGFEGIL